MLLNSELCQKLVRINMAKCYPVVVKGLLATQQEKHWNSSVTNLTFQTIRVYMEMSKEHFEKYTQIAKTESKTKASRQETIKA